MASVSASKVMFQRVTGPGLDSDSYSCILREIINSRALVEGKKLHAHIIKTGFWFLIFLQNNLLTLYAKCGNVAIARQVFDKMPERNNVSWSAMLAGYVQRGYSVEAFLFFNQMQKAGMSWNRFTLASVLRACTSLAAQEQGKQIHGSAVKTGFESNNFVGSALVDLYAKCGRIEDAYNVFVKISNPDLVSWNAIVAGLAQNAKFDDARQLFDKMPQRDVTSFNSLIIGYSQNGYDEEALKLFCQIQWAGMNGDEFTFASVVRGCAGLAALNQGKQLHSQTIKTGFDLDIFVGSALVDMYSKCGSIDDAFKGFKLTPKRNVVLWTTMIISYAHHGCGKEALQLFEEMRQAGARPNRITFIGVLSACCYLGLVKEGCYYFDSMSRDYGISAQVEHYTCMVDMLGRAGLLAEAVEFVYQMPFEPDPVIWRTLLGACRVHGNVELGKHAAEIVLRQNPQDASSYKLLSNIYATAGRWDDVANVRKILKERVAKKEPGLSWIEVKNKVHSFVAGDRKHTETEKIYAQIEELNEKMKEVGYVPDTSFALHDIDKELKKELLCHHSEKAGNCFRAYQYSTWDTHSDHQESSYVW